ncbi:MAG: hypothetical protein HPZ91_04700 [Lentisphaeria bacterium]|nr:hypothetical protein [Lentisphaeria bacterium]
MNENESGNTARAQARNNDLRTFLIALLTAVIAIAIYHFGLGLCRMFCPPCDGYMRPTSRYMLIPVMEYPQCGRPDFRKSKSACFGTGKYGSESRRECPPMN